MKTEIFKNSTSKVNFTRKSKNSFTKITLVLSLLLLMIANASWGQTYYNMSSGNYTQAFTGWSGYATNWNGLAILSTGTIPIATKTTAATNGTLGTVTTGTAIGYDVATSTKLVFLSTGATDNTSAVACDLNLDFTGRNAGTISFDAATIFNSTGNRVASLKLYYSINGTNWTEITGTNLPYIATNNVAGSASISVTLPAALNNQSTVKLRFYQYNGSGGTTGSRPKISIDNISVTSTPAITNYTVTYNGNGSTGGSAPTDGSSPYSSGATVTVLGNTGSLVKTGYSFSNWNTASDGTGTTYAPSATFTIAANTTLYAKWLSSDATLSALTLSSGTLSPAFASGTISYSASVTNATSSVTVTPTFTQANATIQARVNSGSYSSVTSGTASGSLALNVGDNTIDVLVTAQDGTTKTYTITVNRASASSPTITIGSISAFGNQCVNTTSGELTYSVSGANLTADIALTAPTGYEISKTSGSGFGNSTTLLQSGGTVTSTTIYVRFSPTLAQLYSGNITHTSTGATQQDLALTGTGTSPVAPSVSIAVTTGSNPTCPNTSVTFTATPTNGGTPTYQWKKDGGNVGTNSATFTDAGSATGSITCEMTTSLTCVSSATVTSNAISLTQSVPNVTSPGATAGNTQVSVAWSNPSCYDEIMIVAAPASNNGTPTGDGSAYTANLAYPSGTGLGNGYVAYKGTSSPQIITGLTNGTVYYFKIFTRKGSVWSAGTEVSATPVAGPCLSEGFDASTNDPSGWSNVSAYYNATAMRSGTNGAGMNALADLITTPTVTNPQTLTFWGKASSTSASYTITIETSTDNISYTSRATFTSNGSNTGDIKNSFSQFTANLNLTGTYYIRFNMSARSAGSFYFDDVEVYCGTPCTAPVTATTNFGVSNVTDNSMDVSYTRGSGDGGVLVVARAGSAVNSDPVSNTIYTANNSFSLGDQIGTGNYVVYNGSNAGFSLSGLAANTTYHFAIYEYNATSTCYNLVELTGNATTACATPTTQASLITTSGATTITIPLAFTIGNGGRRIVKMNTSNSFTNPVNGTDYTGTAAYSGSGEQVVYSGTGNSVTITGLTANTGYWFRVYEQNCTGTASKYNVNTATDNPKSISTIAPSPEINLKGNGVSITSGDITPSATDNTDFGNVVWNNTVTRTFTIENLGEAILNLTGAPRVTVSGSSYFTVSAQPNSPVAIAGTTTFDIIYAPTAVGTHTATITIGNDDSNEGTYTFTIQGIGKPSNLSDIQVNSGFTYSTNINYLTYIDASHNITSTNSLVVGKFTIYDGGTGLNDADNLATIMTSFNFNVAGSDNLDRVALYDGSTEIAEVAGGTPMSFSSLNVNVPDGTSKEISIRVLFKTAVTDNQQFRFSVFTASASTSGSSFINSFGTQQTSITGDNNRIEVTATDVIFNQNTTNVSVGAVMAPSPTVLAVDENVNTDLDYTSSWSTAITTGSTTFGTATTTGSFTAGVATLNNLVFATEATGNKITISSGAFSDISSLFDVINFTYAAGDYRPTSDYTNFSFNNNAGATNLWEYFNGSTWTTTPFDKAPANVEAAGGSKPARIIINRPGIVAAGTTTKTYNDIIIQSGGELYIVDDDAPPVATEVIMANKKIEVQSGGKLFIEGDIDLPATGALIVRSGGEMTIDQASMVNTHPMWDGVENFEVGSTVKILNWNFGASASVTGLVNVSNTIANNSNGYKFGNLIVNVNTISDWAWCGGDYNEIINLVYNDVTVDNAGTGYIGGITNRTAPLGYRINGNLIVNSGNFNFSATYNSDDFEHQAYINGNFEFNSAGNLYLHRNAANTPTSMAPSAQSFVHFKGNVVVNPAATFTNQKATDNSRMYLEINGSGTSASPQLLDIGVTTGMTGINTTIKNNTFCKLKSHNWIFNGITGLTTALTIETGSSLHFGWADDGTTPLIATLPGGAVGTNTFTTQTGTTLYMTHADGLDDGTTITKGNVQQFTQANRTINQVANFWYVGKTDQQTGSGITSTSTNKLIGLDMIDGTKTTTLTTAITTTGKLILKAGVLSTTATNLFTIGAGGSVHTDAAGTNGVAGSASSFVDGPIKKIGNSAFVFPTGDVFSGTRKWARVGISAPTTATTEYTAEYNGVAYGDLSVTSTPFAIDHVSSKEFWNLTQSANDDVVVKLFWEDNVFSDITNCSSTDLRIAHYNGSDWELNIDEGTVNCGASGDITTTTKQPSFSPFTFAFKAPQVLPIELLNFNAIRDGKNVKIDWSTASETNNNFFTVERSKDATNFEFLGNYAGAGFSTSMLKYSTIDNAPYLEKSYYRLKQTDYDGNFSYSNIVAVNGINSDQNTDITILKVQNSVEIGIENELNADYTVQIIDVFGRILYQEKFKSSSEKILIPIDDRLFARGVYTVAVSSGILLKTAKIIW